MLSKIKLKFLAMLVTYSLGVFNDNFFKQAAIFFALKEGLHNLQGYAAMLFTLPYIFFAAPSGWLADRFSKGKIIIWAKLLEVIAMIIGAVGIYTGNWAMILAMVFTMGFQSAIFSPSINGSIPELFPEDYVIKANAILKVFVTMMILMGIAIAGPLTDAQILGVKNERIAVPIVVLVVALSGFIFSFAVPQYSPADSSAKFPYRAIVNTILDIAFLKKDKLLFLVVISNTYIWFIGSLQVLIINKMGIDQFKFSNTATSVLIASELIGIAIGGMLSTTFAKGRRWYFILPISGFMIFIFTTAISFTPLLTHKFLLPVLSLILAIVGIFGGLFMIPCESFIQIRPLKIIKGKIIATSNFFVFSGILISGIVANFINERYLPTNGFLFVGALSFIFCIYLFYIMKTKDLK